VFLRGFLDPPGTSAFSNEGGEEAETLSAERPVGGSDEGGE